LGTPTSRKTEDERRRHNTCSEEKVALTVRRGKHGKSFPNVKPGKNDA